MIEFKYMDYDWCELINLKFITLESLDFSYSVFRINGIVYSSKDSDGFQEAFEKEKIWRELRT